MTVQKLVSLTIQPTYQPSSIPIRIISFQNNSITLTKEEADSLLSEVPSAWHSEKDNLVKFVKFDDGSYFCERYKDYFDYKTRETNKKFYKYDAPSQEEANQLYQFLLEKYTLIKIGRSENLYNQILDKISNLSYIKYQLLQSRNQLLKESDYVMIPDYPISEEERSQWIEYRQQLRDMTQQEAWINNDLMAIQMPVSPEPLNQLFDINSLFSHLDPIPENIIEQFVGDDVKQSYADIVRNLASISVKYEVLRSFSKLNLPIFSNISIEDVKSDVNKYQETISELEDLANTHKDYTSLPEDWWNTATSNLNEVINNINEKLQQYDMNFTVGDILETIVNEYKLTEEELAAQTLLQDLQEGEA